MRQEDIDALADKIKADLAGSTFSEAGEYEREFAHRLLSSVDGEAKPYAWFHPEAAKYSISWGSEKPEHFGPWYPLYTATPSVQKLQEEELIGRLLQREGKQSYHPTSFEAAKAYITTTEENYEAVLSERSEIRELLGCGMEDDIVEALRQQLAQPAGKVGDGMRNIVAKYSQMEPESDETWESWYPAAFDLMANELSALLSAPVVKAGDICTSQEPHICRHHPDGNPAYHLAAELDELKEAQQAGVAVPEGYKLVPVEPTADMWKAARSVPEPVKPYPPHYGLIWDAMLAAASPQPVQQVGQEYTGYTEEVSKAIWLDFGTAPADEKGGNHG